MLCTLMSLVGLKLTGNCGGAVRDFEIDENCVVTLNGMAADLSDLKGGDKLEIDGQPAVRIVAQRRA